MKHAVTLTTALLLVSPVFMVSQQAIGQGGARVNQEAAGNKMVSLREAAEEVYGLPPLPMFSDDFFDTGSAPPPQAPPQELGLILAEKSSDWDAPWLDPRVKRCVREYLDKWLELLNQEQRRKNEPPFTRIDDWGRVLREPALSADRGVDYEGDPTQFVLEEYNKPRHRNSPLGGIQDYVKDCLARGEGGPPAPPSGEEPPSTAGDEKCCERYALLAVCHQRLNIVRDCGLGDPPARWHLDYRRHYDWCLAVEERFADYETRIREEQLRECLGEGPPGQPPGPPTEGDGDCECVNFAWAGMTTAEDDRVGRVHNPNRDGLPDGQFNLAISCPSERIVTKMYLLGPADQWDRRPQFDTDPGGPHYLGVWRNGQRVNPTDQSISDRIEGQAGYELFAGDPNAFQDGNRYEITVTIEGGERTQRLTCPPTMVAKRVPPTPSRPSEEPGTGMPGSQEGAGAPGEGADEQAGRQSEADRPSFEGALRVYLQGWWILNIKESDGRVSGTIEYEKDPKRGKGTLRGERRDNVKIGAAPPQDGIRGDIAMVREVQKWNPETRKPYAASVEHDFKRFQFRIEDNTRLRGEICTQRKCFSAIGEKISD